MTRAAILGVVGVALAAWLAAAGTSGTHQIVLPPPTKTSAVDVSSAELAAEIARLHDRLHPTTAPREPARNLFEFKLNAARMAAPAGSVDIGPTAAVSEPIAAPDPAFALIGVAGDGVDGGDGGGRTAIIAGPGQLFLVKEGDLVAEHYRVRRVSADAVDLDEMTSAGHAALHLTLK